MQKTTRVRGGGLGVIDIKTTERNGPVIGAVQVRDEDQIMMISDTGTLVRTAVSEVSVLGRNTQGVRLIKVGDSENLVEIAAINEEVAGEDAMADDDDSATDDSASDSDSVSNADADADQDGDQEPDSGTDPDSDSSDNSDD